MKICKGCGARRLLTSG